MKTITKIRSEVRNYLKAHKLSQGLGNAESACTIAALNLAITGELTDNRPDCVCPVIHRWVIPIQDAMPDNMRNNGWTKLVPLIAGSLEPQKEERRKNLILDWMWAVVLPQLLPVAKKYGFEKKWEAMLVMKTSAAAYAARAAAYASVAGDAAYPAGAAARAAAYADAAYSAEAAAEAAAGAAAEAADGYWEVVNPTNLLKALLEA